MAQLSPRDPHLIAEVLLIQYIKSSSYEDSLKNQIRGITGYNKYQQEISLP